jgi:hypothetical protein
LRSAIQRIEANNVWRERAASGALRFLAEALRACVHGGQVRERMEELIALGSCDYILLHEERAMQRRRRRSDC